MLGVVENLLNGVSITLVLVVFFALFENSSGKLGRYLWIVSRGNVWNHSLH